MTYAINSAKANFYPDEAVELPSPDVVVETSAGERLPNGPIEQLDDQTVLVNTVNEDGDVVPAVGQLPPPIDLPTMEQIARDLGYTSEELTKSIAAIEARGATLTHDTALDVIGEYAKEAREQGIRRELGRLQLTEIQIPQALKEPEFNEISSDPQAVQNALQRYRARQTAEDREDNNPWHRR